MVRRSCSTCSECRFIGTSIFATKSSPYSTRRPCLMSTISIAKTSAACRNSSCVKKSGAGSFCSTHHHFTTPASRPSSSTDSERKIQTTLRSECPSRKSPRAAEPNKMTHSKLLAANSFNRFTSSASLASVERISASSLNSTAFLRFGSFQLPFSHLPDAPPPPLLPPPTTPHPPPPPHPPDPPPTPPPFHPPPHDPRREVLSIIPSQT